MNAAVEDNQARADARLALERIATHERQCAERYEGIRRTNDDLLMTIRDQNSKATRTTEGIYARFWWLMGLIVAGQGAVILILAAQAFR